MTPLVTVWRGRVLRGFVAALALPMCEAAAGADVDATAREIIDAQQRILVLRDFAAPTERAEARRAGQYLFFRSQHLSRLLVQEVLQMQGEVPQRYRQLVAVPEAPDYTVEDGLALRGTLEALLPKLPGDQRRDATRRLAALAQLRKEMGDDFGIAFQQVPLRGGRPVAMRWAAYLQRLNSHLSVKQILAELDQELIAAPPMPADDTEAVVRARVLEWNGEELPQGTVLLTFDDGPHAVFTPAVLDILKSHGVHAIFFQVGRNLGEVRDGLASAERGRDIDARLISEGHAVGNHSFTHPLLTKLDSKSVEREIGDTQLLIEAAVPQGAGRTGGFRPPYGARDDKVLAEIESHHLRSIVWNIDSEDWADPLPESIAHRVVQEAERNGRGIVLMHDIHARTADALPRVISELKKRGFRFLRWDGQQLVVESPAAAQRLE